MEQDVLVGLTVIAAFGVGEQWLAGRMHSYEEPITNALSTRRRQTAGAIAAFADRRPHREFLLIRVKRS